MDHSKTVSAAGVASVTGGAVVCLAVGASVFPLGIVLDWSGLWGGFGLGAGLGLIIIGTYFLGFAHGIRRSGPRAGWLPSQDPQG